MKPRVEDLISSNIKPNETRTPKIFRELLSLMYRYKEALNHAIKVVIEDEALTLGKAHRLLYNILKEKY
ncbi:MAG: hypothetical protein QXE10_02615 [Desulfurococcaceae archaeon]